MSPLLLVATGCVVAAAGAAMMIVVVIHNCLAARQAVCEHAWSDVKMLLSRRHAAAAELVEILLPHVDVDPAPLAVHGRTLAAGDVREIASATARLAVETEALLARAEAHPLTRSSERVSRARSELVACSRAIHDATRSYDAAVLELDRVRDTLPGRGVARALGCRQRDAFAGAAPLTAAVRGPAGAVA